MKRFKKIYIEITNVCNLSCHFCPKTKRTLKYNDKESFKHILKAVKPYTDHIYLHLMGEPTSHPELETYLAMSAAEELKVNLTTNGTLIDKVKDVLINAPALRQVNISLHSFEANDGGKTLENYVDNIAHFILEAGEKSNVICSMRLWNMDNEELKGSNKLNQDIISLLQEKLEPEVDIRSALMEREGIKLRKNVYLNRAKKFEWPDEDRDIIAEEVFCYGLRDQVGILVDGTVVPCCLDSEGNIPLGNIFEESFEEIIKSPRARDLYEGFSNRKAVESLCKRCGYAMRYKK